jgi:hypothetical protein
MRILDTVGDNYDGVKKTVHASITFRLRAALAYIEKYGDREVFVEARRLRQWLSQVSSASSAG